MAVKTISVLGCGWMGLPLAQHLLRKGYKVKGSSTQFGKLKVLQQYGIEAYLINADPVIVKDKSVEDFFQADVLFLNIPFKRSLQDPQVYKFQIESVIQCVAASPVKFVIYASSTSVYPDAAGEISENDFFEPATQRAQVLSDIEQMLLADERFQATVVRFGGLYGAQRKIGQFLSGKNVTDPQAPVNLIHLDDCVGIISSVIEQNVTGEIFNAVSDAHPTKRELYTKAALALGLPAPHFSEDRKHTGKIVLNHKLKHQLHYSLKHPDPLREN